MRFSVRFSVCSSVLAALAFVLLFQSAAFADFNEGRRAYDKRDWKNAIINLRPEAERGDDRAMVILANMYSDGLGVQKDLKEAFGLYHRAAQKNNSAGIIAVATMYQNGFGVDPNGKLGIDWFKRSAELGHQTGAFFYGVALYQGSKGATYDVKPDHKEAYKWFRIAAKSDTNDRLKKAAATLGDTLAKQLTGEDLTAADREVLLWKPKTPEELGPFPEVLQKQALEKNGAAPAEDSAKPAPATETPATEAIKAEEPAETKPAQDVTPEAPQ